MNGHAFLFQRQTLLHAEAMLFVNDGETEIGELDGLFNQRVSADRQQDLARGNRFGHLPPLRLLYASREPGQFDAQRL